MRPLLLDLFCCAGGAAMGYHRAGFDVYGVDIELQKNYPFRFGTGDALSVLASIVENGATLFDGTPIAAIHASPPCHDHSTITGRNRKAQGVKGTAWMLEATLELLRSLDIPWVVENVETAKFPDEFFRARLCGSSFGLDVRRHRWFASNIAIMQPPCVHHLQAPRFRSLDSRMPEGFLASVVGVHGHLNYPGEFELRKAAMGIDWMTNAELSQAIPPAYTEYIGCELLNAIWAAA